MANLEAKLTISAEDKTAAAFAAIQARVERMHREASRISNSVGVAQRMASYVGRGAPSAPSAPRASMVPPIIPGFGMGLPAIIGAAAITAGVKQAVTNFADLEDKVTSLGITAEATDAQIKAAMRSFREIGPQYGVTAAVIAGAAEKYVAAGVDFDKATAATPAAIRAAKASGSELNDIVDAGVASMNNLDIEAGKLDRAFDIMAKGGKLGQFELRNMAKELPALTSRAKALGLVGEGGLTKIVAMAETARKTAATGEEAANNLVNLYDKITSQDTVKHFNKVGVDLKAVLEDGAKHGVDYVTTFVSVVKRLTGGDAFKIAALVPDRQAREGLLALIKNAQSYKEMIDQINKTAIGTNLVDLKRRMETTKAAIDKMSSSWDAMIGTFGETISPAAVAVMDGVTKALQASQHPVETATDSLRVLRDKADAGAAPYDPSVRPGQRKANRLFNALIGRDGDAAFGEAPLPATDNWAGLTPGKWLAPEIPYDPSVRPGQRKANRLFNSLFGREGDMAFGEAPPRFAIPSFGFDPAGTSGRERAGASVAPGLLAFAGKGVLPPVKLEGSADISVKVEVSTEPGLIAREVSRQLSATGALSPATGTSMPEASPTGRSGGF